MGRLNLRQRAQRASVAVRELHLSALTQADKNRCYAVEDGLAALDDEQAEFKAKVEELCNEYWNPNAPDDACAELVRKLKHLLVPQRGWRERPAAEQAGAAAGSRGDSDS